MKRRYRRVASLQSGDPTAVVCGPFVAEAEFLRRDYPRGAGDFPPRRAKSGKTFVNGASSGNT